MASTSDAVTLSSGIRDPGYDRAGSIEQALGKSSQARSSLSTGSDPTFDKQGTASIGLEGWDSILNSNLR